MSDDNDEFRAQLERENALEALAVRIRAGRDLQGLIERYLDSQQAGYVERVREAAERLKPEMERYLRDYSKEPSELTARCEALLPELTLLVPATLQPPAPTPVSRSATRAELSRIVPPNQPAEPSPPAEVIYAGYILMPRRRTYALGVQALRRAFRLEQNADPRHRFVRPDGSWLYRPLTFKETIQARVESYEQSTPEDRLKLFLKWEDSCTGAAYKARTTKFKLIPECEQLITIPTNFNGYFLNVSYNTWDVPELDSAAPGTKFNQQLTPNEVEENEGWRAAVENDLPLLRTFRDIVWDACERRFFKDDGPARFMGFYVRQNTPTDELRPLFVRNLNFNSLANYGAEGANLNDGGSFLRVAP